MSKKQRIIRCLLLLAAVFLVAFLVKKFSGTVVEFPTEETGGLTSQSPSFIEIPTETAVIKTTAAAESSTDEAESGSSAETSESEAASEDQPIEFETVSDTESRPAPTETAPVIEPTTAPGLTVIKDGTYSDKEHVALYIHTYGRLPSNYITKKKAEDLGWNSSKGNLWKVSPGSSIGGSSFGNYEGLLPKKSGRKYYECDIDYDGGYRNAKRIIYSNDGLIYYTEDHYESFELLYGEE